MESVEGYQVRVEWKGCWSTSAAWWSCRGGPSEFGSCGVIVMWSANSGEMISTKKIEILGIKFAVLKRGSKTRRRNNRKKKIKMTSIGVC